MCNFFLVYLAKARIIAAPLTLFCYGKAFYFWNDLSGFTIIYPNIRYKNQPNNNKAKITHHRYEKSPNFKGQNLNFDRLPSLKTTNTIVSVFVP